SLQLCAGGLDRTPTRGSPKIWIPKLRKRNLDDGAQQVFRRKHKVAIVVCVRSVVHERRHYALMDDRVARIGETHEPLLEIRDLHGCFFTVPGKGARVNRWFGGRPDEPLCVGGRRIWHGLEELPERLRADMTLARSGERLECGFQEDNSFRKMHRRSVPPRLD